MTYEFDPLQLPVVQQALAAKQSQLTVMNKLVALLCMKLGPAGGNVRLAEEVVVGLPDVEVAVERPAGTSEYVVHWRFINAEEEQP